MSRTRAPTVGAATRRSRRAIVAPTNLFPFAVAVAVLASVGGIAFACQQTGGGCDSGFDHDDSCSSSPGIEWTTPDGSTASAPTVSCGLSLSSSTLTVTVSNLAPGESCAFHADLRNVGSSSVSITEALSHSSTGCTGFYYSDSIPTYHPLAVIGGDSSLVVRGSAGLATLAGDDCEHSSETFVVTVTPGSASSW
jgi:hypothetical protein